MPLPLVRNTTYAAGSQIKSADLNDLQDCIVSDKHGTQTLVVPLFGPTSLTITPPNSIALANPNFLVVPFQLPVGRRVTAIRVQCVDSVTGPTRLQCALYDMTNGGGGSAPGTLSTQSAGSGVQQTISATGLASTIVAGHTYGVYVARSTGTTTCTINGIEIDYDRP